MFGARKNHDSSAMKGGSVLLSENHPLAWWDIIPSSASQICVFFRASPVPHFSPGEQQGQDQKRREEQGTRDVIRVKGRFRRAQYCCNQRQH
jgi:hypothetical protein